jgi:hypothetical protein
MNLTQTQKRLDEMVSHHILYKIGDQYNMTPEFKKAIAKKFMEIKKADETIAIVLVDFFVEVNEADLVDYIAVIENFIDRDALKEMEV